MGTSNDALLEAALQVSCRMIGRRFRSQRRPTPVRWPKWPDSLRDDGFGRLVTYSRKVFIPLTHLCRDVCHYCTFAQTPKRIGAPYMSIEQVVDGGPRGARARLQGSAVHAG